MLYVSNITDIDDNLIKKGQADGTTMQEVARKFVAEYIKDYEGLNVKTTSVRPRATEHIGETVSYTHLCAPELAAWALASAILCQVPA